MKKFIILLTLILVIPNFIFCQKNSKSNLNYYLHTPYHINMQGDVFIGTRDASRQSPNVKEILNEIYSPSGNIYDNINTMSMIYTGASTIYDAESNGTPYVMIQDKNNPNSIHAVFMCAPSGDPNPAFPNTRSKYYFSTNKGQTWTFVADCPAIRSYNPAIELLVDGRELIANHNNQSGTICTAFYVDNFAGSGSFNSLTPPLSYYKFPRLAATSSITLNNKFIGLSSYNSTNNNDSAFYIISQSNTPPVYFSPWTYFAPAKAESYQISRGGDGRIGIVYIINNVGNANFGSVYFIESTNNGNNFSTPLKIYNPNFAADSLAAFRGLGLTYSLNSPKIVFEIVKQKTDGSYFPGAPAKIMFWSTSLSGIDPNRCVTISDSSNTGWHPYISKGSSIDLFAAFCRPSIGSSGSILYSAFMSPSGYVGGSPDTCSFMDIYISYSSNGGTTWKRPERINSYSPVRDWTYPCISPTNDTSTTDNYVNMMVLVDSMPGSYPVHPLNGESLAKYYFIRGGLNDFPGYSPAPPFLISPANGSLHIPLATQFIWNPTANSYTLQIAQDTAFTIGFHSINITTSSNSFILPTGILYSLTSYYWRMNATNIHGTSPWSKVWIFTTNETGIQLISGDNTKENKLYNNYPNPFNSNTKIDFAIQKNGFVTLKIYDILGREVKTLIDENKTPGLYSIDFNASEFPSGVYFYRIKSGNFIAVKKMLVIK